MKSALRLLPVLVVLLWANGAEARQFPNRAQVETAVNAWFACHPGQECSGPPFRRRLTRSHCMRLPQEEAYPERILCLFSGLNIGGGMPTNRFRNDCVYMIPEGGRGWRVSSIPDADVCE